MPGIFNCKYLMASILNTKALKTESKAHNDKTIAKKPLQIICR
jgi:hypothetical protein